MLQHYTKQVNLTKDSPKQALLQLLLFVDRRPSSQEQIQRIQSYLQSLKAECPFDLQVMELSRYPHLVEYFKLVATPALVKIAPGAKQTLAGSDLIPQLKKWWPRWQNSLAKAEEKIEPSINETLPELDADSDLTSINYSGKIIKLSDEIFRLKKEKEELLQQLQFKDQILAMLAHDLRSPLTAASIALETLELAENSKNQERAAALKEQLYKQAKNQFQIMDRMINDILQASKTVKAQWQLRARKLYLQSLCYEILTEFQERLNSKSQTLEKDIPQDLPPIYGDEELLRQVIVNLLDNAVKYTPTKGKISISILHRTSQKIQVNVCDNGPGIPKEKRDCIFEGYFRLRRDQEKEGYGLGLSVCRQVIQAHYGQIWVDGSPEGGSCFHFTLPVYRQ